MCFLLINAKGFAIGDKKPTEAALALDAMKLMAANEAKLGLNPADRAKIPGADAAETEETEADALI
jgi:phage terminase small subunit